jgi:hypothetical protein
MVPYPKIRWALGRVYPTNRILDALDGVVPEAALALAAAAFALGIHHAAIAAPTGRARGLLHVADASPASGVGAAILA